MKDILPDEIALYRFIHDAAESTFSKYGYEEIQTPILEETNLFARGIGETTDIVEKEMFTLKDEGLTLRPEGTASVARAYVEHAMHKEKAFRKFYYAGPFFRKERPQKGRFRQFHQIGLEAIGSDDPLIDAEIIIAACDFLDAAGLEGYEVRLNSIGCRNCRSAYRELLKESLSGSMAGLCENCKKRFERNVFRVLDCKQDGCQAVAATAPTFRDRLCDPCTAHLADVEKALDSASVSFVFDPHLVRGFDYYTRTVFEITHNSLGAQNAIAAGGRYDGLIEQLGGPALPGVGFSAGCERIAMLLSARKPDPATRPLLYAVYVRDEQKSDAFALISMLRAEGIACDMNYEGKSLKAQMRSAEKAGCRFAAILGPDEVSKGLVKLKDMESGEESEIPVSDVADQISKTRDMT